MGQHIKSAVEVHILSRFHESDGAYVQIGDARIYVEEAGDPNGEPLVLLHGGLGSMADFNGIIGELSDRFRLVGIDFRGHGKSTLGSESLTYMRYQADVEAVLDHIGVETYSLLGFSDGGIVGYRLAAEPPARVRILVTVGAQWRLKPDDPVLGMLRGVTPEIWREKFPDSVRYYEAVNPQPDFDRLVKAVVPLWLDAGPTGYPGEMISGIKAPTLIVRGDDDRLQPLDETVELRRRIASSSFLNVPFAGHEVHKDAKTMFLLAVTEFFNRTERIHEKG